MTNWKIDTAHATATFKVKHLGISWVPGHLTGISGDISFDPENPEASKFTAELDLTTLTTGLEMRDGHLKGADFFDTEKYPKMKFESSSMKKISETDYLLEGNLTIKDVSKQVEIKAEFLGEADKQNMDGTMSHVAAFALKTQIDRRDWGLNWNIDLPGGAVLVGNEVYIEVDFEAIRD